MGTELKIFRHIIIWRLCGKLEEQKNGKPLDSRLLFFNSPNKSEGLGLNIRPHLTFFFSSWGVKTSALNTSNC